MYIISCPALRGASPETCRGRSSGEGQGRRCGLVVSSDETGKPGSLMRRPRFGLVSRAPGGPGQPSAGTKTGRPMSGAARGGDEGAVATAPDRGPTGGICRRPEARLKGTQNAAQWSAGRRLPPIARRKETPRKRLGRPRQPLRGLANPASAGAPLPSTRERDVEGDEGLPGADQRARAMNHVSVVLRCSARQRRASKDL